jgi:O-antigen ligase
MRHVVDIGTKKETIPFPLVCILLFYSGTVIALQMVFPVLRAFYPQTIFAGIAILFSALYFLGGKATFKLERVQTLLIAYSVFATIGLYRSAEVGFLLEGKEIIFVIYKQLIFLVILVLFTRTLFAITFAHFWILLTVAVFVLHSFKAIVVGYAGSSGRFDNYVGLITNSDYIGIFVAIFVVVFMHMVQQTRRISIRLFWFALSMFSIVVMVKTQTRAAVIVLGILATYWIFVSSSSTAEICRKGIAMLLVVGVFVFIGSISSSKHGSYFDRIATMAQYNSDVTDFNTKSRYFMWEQGLAVGLANPLLGVGSGATAPYMDLQFEGVELKNKASKVEGFSIHNTFIQIFAERGIVGEVFFCLILLSAYKNFNMVANYSRDSNERIQLAVLADVGRLYLVGYFVGSFFVTIDSDWTLFAFVALAVSSKRYIDLCRLSWNSQKAMNGNEC